LRAIPRKVEDIAKTGDILDIDVGAADDRNSSPKPIVWNTVLLAS
jgi:hypothetical protein